MRARFAAGITAGITAPLGKLLAAPLGKLLAAPLAALFLVVSSGLARAGEQSAVVDDVHVTLTSNWPSTLNRGWQPITVRIDNPTDDERTISMLFTSSSSPSTDAVSRRVRVPAHDGARFELALPVRASLSNSYFVNITSGGDRQYMNIGAEQMSPVNERIVLVASRGGPTTVDTAGWATRLSEESDPRAPEDHRKLLARGVTSSSPTTPEHVRVAGIAYENLSELIEAYSSLHALVLDVGEGALPSRGALDAIEGWVRTGGVLAIGGRGAWAVIAKEPALSAWVEPRFRVRESPDVVTYACGLGTLIVFEGDAVLASPDQVIALNKSIEALAPLNDIQPRSAFDIAIPGVEVPFRSLTLILVLFAILVGPVNLILVRRSKRPALLLLTIPAISIVFSVGLVVYGAAAQGLDVRATSQSIGVLDQRSHHGSSHERRLMFAGLAVGDGIRPGPGTVVQRAYEASFDWRKRDEYTTTYASGTTLSGAWLPVRTPTKTVFTVDRAARGRIDIEHTADGWKATNGLDSPVTWLVFRDTSGDMHLFDSTIAPGRSGVASAVGPDSNSVRGLESANVLAETLEDGAFLPRGAWIGRVGSSALLDPCGIQYEEKASNHVVMGILEPAGKR